MIRIFGDNNWSVYPSSRTETIILDTKDLYSNQDDIILKKVRSKYEGKSNRGCFIKKVIKILEYKPWECITYEASGKGETHVVFEALVDSPKIGDTIIGAECVSGGRGNDPIKLQKDYLIIWSRCNSIINQVIEKQIFTLRIRDITWVQSSPTIEVVATFTHSYPKVNKTYMLNSAKAIAFKELFEPYIKTIKEFKVNKEMSQLAYTFTNDQSDNYKLQTKSILDIIDSLLKGEVETVYIMTSSFLYKDSCKVYMIPKPSIKCNEINTKNGLLEILEDIVKHVDVLMEMEKIEYKQYLLDFYKTSKLINDNQISKITNSYIV